MPVFEYRGLSAEGRDVQGILDAENPKVARLKLRQSGIFPVELSETHVREHRGEAFSFSRLYRRAKKQEVAVFTRQMATLLSAGLPLMESLSTAVEQIEDPVLRKVITQVREGVKEGKSLSETLRGYPRVFSDLYVNMITAGESSGTLDIVLARLADFQESQARLQNKIWATLTYPIMMLFIGIGVLAFLFAYVIPQVTGVFEDIGEALPLPTRVLILISDFFREYGWVLLILLAVAGFAVRRYLHTPAGKAYFDRASLKLPLFGRLVKMVALSRFARTLSTLLSSGVPLMTALDIVKEVVGNKVLYDAIEAAKERVREGEGLSEPLRRSGVFPSVVVQMIAVGERSGEMERMLLKVSEAYENEVDTTVSGLTSLLEPVMILFMGLIVLFIVLSILLPIFEMSQVVR
jgi:general secretion pathway protein F